MPLIPEKLASRQDVKSAIACQFWEQPSHSARSIDGLVWSLPCEPPALNLTGSSGLSRTQQLLAAQALGVPAFPSYDANSSGLVFDRVLGKLGGKRWWTAIGGRVKAQRMWRQAAGREGRDKLNSLRDLDNYGLVARGRYQLGRRLTLNGIVESPGITLLSRRAQRRAVAAAEVVSRWVRPQQRQEQRAPEAAAAAAALGLECGAEGVNGLEAAPSSPAATAAAGGGGLAVPSSPTPPCSPSHAGPGQAEQNGEEFRAHGSLKYSLPGHDLTATVGYQQDYVDSTGEYAHVPLAASLDLSSQYRADGLQYRVGLHQVTAPAIEGPSKADQRMRSTLHIQGAVAVEGEAHIWKPSPPQPQPQPTAAAAAAAGVAAGAVAAPQPAAAVPVAPAQAGAHAAGGQAQAEQQAGGEAEAGEGPEPVVGKSRLATALESGRQVDEGGDPLDLPPRRPRGERKRKKKGKRSKKEGAEGGKSEAKGSAPAPEQRTQQVQQKQGEQQQPEHIYSHRSHSHEHEHQPGHHHHHHHHHSHSHQQREEEGEKSQAAGGSSGHGHRSGHEASSAGPAATETAAPRQQAAAPAASLGSGAQHSGGREGTAAGRPAKGGWEQRGEPQGEAGAGGEGNLAELAGASLESFMRPLGELIHTVTHIHEGGGGGAAPGAAPSSGGGSSGGAAGQGHGGGELGPAGLPSPTQLLNISAKTIQDGLRESLHLLEQVRESVAALTSDVQDGSLQRLSQQLADSSGRREAPAAPRRRPYSMFLSQPHLKINGSMGCLARMPLPPLRALSSAVLDPPAPTAPLLAGLQAGAQGGSSASLSSMATASTRLADSWEPYLKGTSLRLYASAGISGQLGNFTRPFLDYTAASLRVDVGLTSPHVVGLLPDPASLDASVSNRPDKHRAFALEGRGSWHSLSASLAQQVVGPVRARADFRFALDPTNMPQNAGERSTIKGLVQTALSVRPSLLEAVFGFDVVLPGTEGAARLACWWSPHRKEAMAELRLF